MKKLLAASWDQHCLNEDRLCCALLQYRNTLSRKDGISPAQKLFGHPMQDCIPAHCRSFAPEWQKRTQEAEQLATEMLTHSKEFYNIHAHSLPDFQLGSKVVQTRLAKLWDIYGIVVSVGPNHRYFIKTQSGRIFVRNHCFLRHCTPASLQPPSLLRTSASQTTPSTPDTTSS